MQAATFHLTGPDAIEVDGTWRLSETVGSLIGDKLDASVDTLADGRSAGVMVVTLSNDRLRLEVVPTRGMGIRSVERDGCRFGWESPVAGPVHPMWVPITEPSGLGWLDGFDELLVRCGLESNGAPEYEAATGRLRYPLHGRIANLAADDVAVVYDADAREIILRGTVTETRFLFHRFELQSELRLRPDTATVRLVDRVTNRSSSAATMQLLYHINFGRPLLEPGSRVVVPARRIVPRDARAAEGIATWDRYGEPTPGFAEQVYFAEPLRDADGRGRAVLSNADASRGAALRFAADTLPCFTLWKNTGAPEDGYVTGLEPATNFPNQRSFEERHGRVLSLPPGASADFELELDFMTTAAETGKAVEQAEALQAGTELEVCDQPRADWCA